ncbi:MAG: hypothetical protein WB421_20415 [Terriglobales bacterium]
MSSMIMFAITGEELRNQLLQVVSDPGAANAFFGRFPYVGELIAGNYSASFDHGFNLLRLCQSVAPEEYERVHKGTPFYWLGTAAFLKHDFETAVFFYDAAVSEDLRINANPDTNSTPSLRFIQVEADQPEQAARALVQETQRRLELAIENYNLLSGRPVGVAPLQLAEIRRCFLRRAVSPGGEGQRTLATAFISFLLEWDYLSALTMLRPAEGTTEPFFIHLFKGCLLFESLLKANPKKTPSGKSLGEVLQSLSSDLGTPHDINIGGIDFPAILASLPNAVDSIPIAVAYAGKVRNTVGHNLGWKAHLDTRSYDSLAAKVAAACLHAIACLYR